MDAAKGKDSDMKKIVLALALVVICGLVLGWYFLFSKYNKKNVVIKPPFDYTSDFSCGLGLVRIGQSCFVRERKDVKYYYINKRGKIKIVPNFEPIFMVYPFSEDLAAVRVGARLVTVRPGTMYPKGGKFGYIDKTGKLVIKPRFDWAYPFSDGMARVRLGPVKGGKFGFIDKTGTLVIQSKFVEARDFHEGFAAVNVDGKWQDGSIKGGTWGIVDKEGNLQLVPKAGYIEDFSEGLAKVHVGEKWGFIDRAGKFAIGPTIDYVDRFSEGLARFEKKIHGWRKNGKWGYIDKSGRIVIEAKYDQTRSFSEGLAAVLVGSADKGDCYEYIDKTGKTIIKTKYNVVGDFSEGLARVAIGVLWQTGKPLDMTWGYINKKGNTVIQPQFKSVGNFSDGIACVRSDKSTTERKYNYIDKSGKFVFEPHN